MLEGLIAEVLAAEPDVDVVGHLDEPLDLCAALDA